MLDDANAQSLVSAVGQRDDRRPDEPAQLFEHGRRRASSAPISAPSWIRPRFWLRCTRRISSTFRRWRLPTKDTLNLRLNLPPSFRDPKSVVVVALPPVGAVQSSAAASRRPAGDGLRAKAGAGAAGPRARRWCLPPAWRTILRCTSKPSTGRSTCLLSVRVGEGRAGAGQAACRLCPPGELTGVVRGQVGV